MQMRQAPWGAWQFDAGGDRKLAFFGANRSPHQLLLVPVLFAVDRLVANRSLLDGAHRVGLVTNDAARLATDSTVHSRTALREVGIDIVRLFGPEHGLGATAADGAPVADGVDPLTDIEVVSLYGARMKPTAQQLNGLDVVLFDIPDVGVRFYTYAWTLFYMMEACAELGIPLIVLDRPNPLGGELARAEGPMLDPSLTSFIGADNIPIRHALTLGELATLWKLERWPQATLRVIPCTGWQRDMRSPETGLAWVPTSPAMPAFESAACYPGTCLFEATNLSVGRGTATAFQVVGAHWLDSAAVLQSLAREIPRGVRFERDAFVPITGPYAGEPCEGIRLIVSDGATFRPVATGLLLLAAVIKTHRLRFAWARYPTAANPSGDGHFERLVGNRAIRSRLDADPSGVNAAMVAEWLAVDTWAARVRPALLYP